MHMRINSLNREYCNEIIISDIDDCILKSTNSIRSHSLTNKEFYFNDHTYNEYKERVFMSAELSEWGKELISLIKDGTFKKVILLTAAKERSYILSQRLPMDKIELHENMPDMEKVQFMSKIQDKCIYVDDKMNVLYSILNKNITKIHYPRPYRRK